MSRAYGMQPPGPYGFGAVLCFFAAQLLAAAKVAFERGKSADSLDRTSIVRSGSFVDPRFVSDSLIEINRNATINFAKGTVTRCGLFDYKNFWLCNRIMLIGCAAMSVVFVLIIALALLFADPMPVYIAVWSGWIYAIIALLVSGFYFPTTFEYISKQAINSLLEEWRCEFETAPSKILVTDRDGDRHFIQLRDEDDGVVAEIMSEHRVCSIIHSPSQTSALMLAEDGQSVLLRIHRQEERTQVLAKRLSARRGRVRQTFMGCLRDIAILLLLCAGTMATGHWSGFFPAAVPPILGSAAALWTVYIATR